MDSVVARLARLGCAPPADPPESEELLNGNTFVTSGPQGRFFEVTAAGEMVWEFWNPYSGNVRESDGTRAWSGDDRLLFGVWRAQKLSPDDPRLAGRTLRSPGPAAALGAPATAITRE